jgi:hypothetical protein
VNSKFYYYELLLKEIINLFKISLKRIQEINEILLKKYKNKSKNAKQNKTFITQIYLKVY